MKPSFLRSNLSGCCLRFATLAAMLTMHPVEVSALSDRQNLQVAIPAAGMEYKHNINILRLLAQTNIFADRRDDTPPPIPSKPGGRR